MKKKQPKNNTKETPLKSKQNVMNNLINIWPANILANNRIAKLFGLIKYEINSIITKPGKITKGTLAGANLSKKCNLCIKAPSIFKPKNEDNDKKNVIETVLVKLFTNGIKPKIFSNKITINKEIKYGLYLIKLVFIFFIVVKIKFTIEKIINFKENLIA